jgi:hypothetical protein
MKNYEKLKTNLNENNNNSFNENKIINSDNSEKHIDTIQTMYEKEGANRNLQETIQENMDKRKIIISNIEKMIKKFNNKNMIFNNENNHKMKNENILKIKIEELKKKNRLLLNELNKLKNNFNFVDNQNVDYKNYLEKKNQKLEKKKKHLIDKNKRKKLNQNELFDNFLNNQIIKFKNFYKEFDYHKNINEDDSEIDSNKISYYNYNNNNL